MNKWVVSCAKHIVFAHNCTAEFDPAALMVLRQACPEVSSGMSLSHFILPDTQLYCSVQKLLSFSGCLFDCICL